MNPKAAALDAYFQKEGLTFFQKHEIGDDVDTVSFVTALPIGPYRLLTGVITDTSIFTVIRVGVGKRFTNFPGNDCFLDFLRKQNANHALFKYTQAESGEVYLDVCLPAASAHFDPQIIRTMLNLLVMHLEEVYPEFLKWLTAPGSASDAF